MGITSSSRMGILATGNELYAAVIDGDTDRAVVKPGKNWGWNPGPGWKLETSGDRYAVGPQPLPK